MGHASFICDTHSNRTCLIHTYHYIWDMPHSYVTLIHIGHASFICDTHSYWTCLTITRHDSCTRERSHTSEIWHCKTCTTLQHTATHCNMHTWNVSHKWDMTQSSTPTQLCQGVWQSNHTQHAKCPWLFQSWPPYRTAPESAGPRRAQLVFLPKK